MSAPFYRMFPREWDDGTAPLTLEQEGALLRICNAINSRGQPLPDDEAGDREMMHRCRVSMRKWRALKAALVKAGKITIRDGLIYQDRALAEVQHRTEMADARAENGAKGGRKRAENALKTARKSPENEGASRKNSHLGQAYPEPEPEPEDTTLNARDVERMLLEAGGEAMADPAKSPGVMVMSEPLSWLRSGADPELDILPTIRAKTMNRPPGSIGSWSYFTAAVMEAKARRERAHETPEMPDEQPSRPAKYSGSAERGRAASEQRKSAWLDAVAELDGGFGGDERSERPSGDAGGGGRIAPFARTG